MFASLQGNGIKQLLMRFNKININYLLTPISELARCEGPKDTKTQWEFKPSVWKEHLPRVRPRRTEIARNSNLKTNNIPHVSLSLSRQRLSASHRHERHCNCCTSLSPFLLLQIIQAWHQKGLTYFKSHQVVLKGWELFLFFVLCSLSFL